VDFGILLWISDIPQTCFEFETDRSILWVAYNNKYLAFRSQCRLFP